MRKTQITISPLILYVNHPFCGYGFSFLTVDYNLKTHSMLMLTAMLPVRGDQNISFRWDFLYLKNYIEEKAHDIWEEMLWNKKSVKWYNRLFHRLFKNV